jgi:hypothetical protein
MTTDGNAVEEAATSTASGEGAGADEVVKLREINQRLQGKLTDVEKKYTQFSQMFKDVDPDEYKKLKGVIEEKERELASKDPAKMEEMYNRKMSKIEAERQAEKEAMAKDFERLKSENKTLKVTDKVMAEISGLFNQDALKFIKMEVEQLCDLDEDGTIIVKNEDGTPAFRNGKYIGIKDFGESLVDKYPSLAKAQGSSGSKGDTPGTKAPGGRFNGKFPQSHAELMSMPNNKEIFERMKREDPEGVQKILKTMKL